MLLVTAAAGAAPKQTVNKNTNRTDLKVKVLPAKLKNAPSAETERSHYFIKTDLQDRLGEDFFNQPCISLAKEFLGKVMLPPSLRLTLF